MGAGQNKLVCFSFIHLKIVKGERSGKWKSHFRFGYAEPYPIFYKDSEKRAEEKWPRFFILNHIVKRDGCKKTAVSFIIIGKRMLLFGHRFI